MHLIFVRHGDPDYDKDSLTEKGFKEAELLGMRASKWENIDHVYISPMGRAQKTAEPILKKLTAFSSTEKWLREFSYLIKDPATGEERICWDWLPHDYYGEKKYSDIEKFYSTKAMKSGNIQQHYEEVCSGLDSILEAYDYNRLDSHTPIYNCFPHLTQEEAKVDTHLLHSQKDLDKKNIVFVCHLGVMFAMLSHLTGISPVQLWQSFYVAPTSVTIVGAEERVPGEVVWRIQSLGDTNHLLQNGETVSACGYFGNCLSI